MIPTLYILDRDGPGRISILARPRSGDWLDDEMSSLRAHGVDVVVSMLTAEENVELGLSDEKTSAEASGLTFYSLPTTDRSVPDRKPFVALLNQLDAELQRGRHVAVHCRMGIGRSSLVAAGLLILQGATRRCAWASVAAARDLEVPDTPAQREWLEMTLATS